MKFKFFLYRIEKKILTKFGLQKVNSINYENFQFNGNKIFHDNLPDHISVIKDVFIKGSHNFDFCIQAKKIFKLYNSKSEEFNILDLGAHIGATSVFFAVNFPNSTIQCVEPFEGSFEILKKNLQFHKNVIFKNCLIGNDNLNDVIFYDNKNDSWAFGIEKSSEKSTPIGKVNMVSFIEIMKVFVSKDNFLLKVDIEGAEDNIFSKRENWDLINEFQVVIVEIHDWMFPGKKTTLNIFAWVVYAKREVCIKGENLWFFK